MTGQPQSDMVNWVNWQETDRLDRLIEAHNESDATAVIEAATGKRISYAELGQRVRAMAQALKDAGVEPGDKVVVRAEKSIDVVVAMFAIMRRGAASVPLDPELPTDRLRGILNTCAVRFVIAPGVAPAADYEAQPATDLTGGLRLLYRPSGECDPQSGDQTAYVIFTSGSTGRPKGVPISHRAALSFLRSAQDRVKYVLPMTFLNVSPLFFDASILDVYLTLAHGGELVLAPKIVLPSQVGDYLEQYSVTDVLMVSSLLKLLVGRFSDLHKRDIRSLRSIWYGAEPCAVKVLKDLKVIAPQLKFIHGYGPTEATHTTTMYVTSRLSEDDDSYLPIGTPLSTVEVIVVDADLHPVPPGEVGELLITGAQLMDGYLHDDELNAAAFVSIGGKRYYRSNDLVKADPHGNLIFVGRRDDAVKVQGHLVYLSELESVAVNFPRIEDAVATVYETAEGMKSLALHYVADSTWVEAKLLSAMSRKLPKYMLPSRLVRLDAENRELLPTGKLNRRKLAAAGQA